MATETTMPEALKAPSLRQRLSRYSTLRNWLILLVLWGDHRTAQVGRRRCVCQRRLPYWRGCGSTGRIIPRISGRPLKGRAQALLSVMRWPSRRGCSLPSFPLRNGLARGVNVALFALPPIAISPILVITFSGMTPRIILAAIGCYFVTMSATVTGIQQTDRRIIDLVQAYGGRQWKTLI